ncbi:MAG: iqgap-related protein [Marteilia pararefringens]
MDHSEYYLSSLIDYRLHQESASLAKSSEPQTLSYILEREQVEMAVEEANRDIESEIRLMQALDKLNKSITEKDEQQMLEDLANPELKIENIKPENSGLYLDNLNKSLDNNPDSLDITNIQKIINESNGVKETRIKINNIVDEIFERAKEDDFDKVSDLLSSNLLDFKFEKANVAIYSSFLKENKSSGSAQNEQVDGDNSSQYADLGLQQSDFDSLLEEKLEKISKAIEAGDKMTIDAKNLAELTISLENCESDPSVIEKYASSELTGLKHLMHSDRAQLYAKFLSQKFHKNHRLHRSLAISGTQTSDVQASGEVLTDVKQTNSVKSNEDGGNVAENDYDGPKLAITEYPGEDPDFFRCVTQNGREFIYDESLNMVIWDASESPKYLNKVSNNPKRLTIHKMESILKKANEFHATASHTAEIEKLQEIIKMQLLHSKYRDRFNKIAKQNIRIKKVQQFFRNLVGRNDFHNLMSGEKVRFPVVLKFIKILMPTDYDLEKMLELSDLKSEVRGMIIRIQEKETTVKDLELLCSLLVQSKYSESVKDKAIPTAVTSGYLRQERVETLRFYGKFLFCLITFDKYFAQLMYLLDKNEIFDISSTVIPIFNYISTPREEVRILKCILRSITWYIQDEDSLNLLASGICKFVYFFYSLLI